MSDPKRLYKMVGSRKVEIPFFSGIGRQCGRGFGALAQVIGRTTIALLREYVIPAAKHVGADLLEFAVPEIADVVSGGKIFGDSCEERGKTNVEKTVG